MRLLILSFIFLSTHLFSNSSTSSELASLHGEPSALVYGSVNAITGDLVFHQYDSIIKGSQPIYLPRRYISREADFPHLGWKVLPHGMAIVEFDKTILVYVPEPTGISLLYLPQIGAIKTDAYNHNVTFPLELHPDPYQFRAGIVHHHDSNYHPLANKAILDGATLDEMTLKVIHEDGSYRLYKYFQGKDGKNELLLEHERLSNGNIIYYDWKTKDNTPLLKSIQTCSPNNTPLASAKISFEKKEIHVTTSDSHVLKYKYTNKYSKKIHLLASAITSEYPQETCVYNKQLRLKEKKFPNGRNLQIKYNEDGKVKQLLGPHGLICSFKYYPTFTEVIDLYENKTLYHFDPKTLRLSKIETFQGKHDLLKTETFSWDSLGNLTAKQISSDLTFSYTYDNKGKVKSKTVQGAITLDGKTEQYTTSYVYNEQNLLTEEKEDNGNTTCYTYLAGTNLPTSKVFKKNDRILKRILYEYNENNFLIKEILDDGPNFTERHIKKITPKTVSPFFGLPEIIEELYQEGAQQILLKKTHLTYDLQGNVTVKTIYDSEQNPRYREENHYNDKGQIVKEIDPERAVTTYAYDPNGNKTLEISPLGLNTSYTYDQLNHCLSKQQENYCTVFSSFTMHGKPGMVQDPLTAITHFEYDALGNLLISKDHLGNLTKYTYNTLGQQKTVTDSLGNTTVTTHNIYGSPLTITHPDGTQEHFTYSLDGQKLTYTDQNNITTQYSYDDFGNIIKEEIFDGNPSLYKIERTYNAFHLLQEIDSERVKTTYIYGPSGRLEKKIYDTLTTTYQYDSLGRCTHETSLDYTLEKSYDNVNRVLSEKEYAENTLLTQIDYTYDAASNILTRTIYPHQQRATTAYTYDKLSREIAKKDPLGNISTTTYSLGHLFYLKQTLEPGNIEIIETYDPFHRKTNTEKKYQSQPIANSHFDYDPCDNLQLHTTTLYRESSPPSKHTVAYTYDTMRRKISEQESNLKTTTYTYTPKGQLATLTKPSGTILTYTYNPLGYLQSLISSDHTINYYYTYNTKGQLVSSQDNIQNISTNRILDVQGNILQETLGNHHTLTSTYDPLNRRTSLTLPNGKQTFYIYEGFNLTSIHFDDLTHNYTYDLSGNIIQEQTINNSLIQKNYDLLNRPTKLTRPTFTQECSYDPRGNLTQMLYHKTVQNYAYDPLDHLITEPQNNYTYDSLHNRMSKNNLSYTVNTLNQIEKTDTPYIYDANGNLIAHNNTKFTYDALDRLIKVTTPEQTYIYLYDSEHRRIAKNNTLYIWDGQHELGTPSLYRILGPTDNAEIGSSITLFINNTPYIPVHDLQGNIIQYTDLSNGPQEQKIFTAFGECFTPSTIPWGYCSKRHDPESELIYFGRRYYDSNLGRFITPDPEGYTDTYNLYAYCSNNPLTHFDPYGLYMNYSTALYRHTYELSNEDIKQGAIGIAHGTAQFAVNTALAAGYYLGGMQTLESMSVLDSYNLASATYQHLKISSENWLRSSLGGDSNNAFYHFAYHGSYMATDFASAMLFPWGATAKVSRAINATREFVNIGTAQKAFNVARELFPARKAKSLLRISSEAENINASTALAKKLSQLEKAQFSASRTKILPDGRIRYYGEEISATTLGPTSGACRVTEYNTLTGQTRSWHECHGHLGNVNRVHPKQINGQNVTSPHYPFIESELIP